MGELLIYKIVISFLVVVVLAEVAKRVSPEWGGTLAGLPLGVGLSLYFITYEQGIDFALQGIPWGIAALSASIMFCLVYILMLRNNISGVFSVLSTALASTGVFMGIGYILSFISFNLISSTIVFLTFYISNIFILKQLSFIEQLSEKPATTLRHLVIRGLVVCFTIITITELASVVGSRWAMILSSFPSTTFPLLLLLHIEDGKRLVQGVIHGFSFSVSTLAVFYLSYVYVIPVLNLNQGYFLIYLICGLYIYLLRRFSHTVTGVTKKSTKIKDLPINIIK